MISHEERNAFILRRTLAAVSWLYAAWSGLLGILAWNLRRGSDLYDPRLIVLHAVVLGLAGTMLWKPRRGALLAVLAAAAGSIFFVVLDLRLPNVPAALVDGAYVPIAAVLLYKSRRQA